MNNERDTYNTARIRKQNIEVEDDIVFEDISVNTTRKPRPSYPRQAVPQVEKPSTPRQSRSIDDRTVSREIGPDGRYVNRASQTISEYTRPSSRTRQARPATRSTNSNDVRPAARQARPSTPTRTKSEYENPNRNGAQRRPSSNNPRRDSYETRDAQYNSRTSRNNKKKSGFTGFKKFLTIYSAALLVIVITVMIILSSFVKNYEKNQPSNLAADIAIELSNNPKSYLEKHKDKINCLENVDAIIEKSAELIGENKVSFIENRNYRADAPSYDFTVDGNTVARVTFATDKKGAFGLNTWKINALEIAEFIPNTLSYTLLAPEGATITINDKPIGDTYKTLDAQIPEQLQTASKFVEVPSFVTYKVSGFTAAPNVKATDANGTELGTTITQDTIVVGATTTQEFIDSVKGRVDDAIENWAKHFISYGGDLSEYILDNCDWYAYIFGSDEINPIATSFYDYEYIGSIEFPVREATNYIKYNDHCFTVDVKYEMKVNFTSDTFHDENQKLNATWVWIYSDKAEQWYIVDCIYK